MELRIGIIGVGFVGSAVAENLSVAFPVHTWDIDANKRTVGVCSDLIKWSDVIFVCVPTPPNDDGTCDTTHVESVVKHIASVSLSKVVVVKSTVPPGTCTTLAAETGLRSIAFNPEFLRQNDNINDFRNQDSIIIGADDMRADSSLTTIYTMWLSKINRQCNILHTSTKEAELFKYVANCFLATKVIFNNDINHLCNKAGIKYSEIVRLARHDKRLGNSHWDVPGPDGHFGFGGACFPKDVSALIQYGEQHNAPLELLANVQYINKFLR
jgi:UDPglucose 6-dehydrogenase